MLHSYIEADLCATALLVVVCSAPCVPAGMQVRETAAVPDVVASTSCSHRIQPPDWPAPARISRPGSPGVHRRDLLGGLVHEDRQAARRRTHHAAAGLGVWQAAEGAQTRRAAGWALRAGHRHTDTGQAGSERSVGDRAWRLWRDP